MTAQTPGSAVPPVAALPGHASSPGPAAPSSVRPGEDTLFGSRAGEPGDAAPVAVGEAAAGAAPLVITVHGTPAPQGSKRHVGNGVMVESSKAVKPWREAVKWAAREAMDGDYPFGDGPLLVDVTFRFARPRSHYRTGRNAHLLRDGAPVYPAGKPDIDKTLRSSLDALGEALVFHDDSRVVAVTMRKLYGDPGARIHVRSVLT